MPANKNAETRYKILDQLQANRYHHYSTEDLRQRVNEELDELGQPPVSIRTIQLDLSYLEKGPFAADIEHYQIDKVSQKDPNKTVKKNCHRYRDRSFSIFQQKLTDDEKHLLGEAFSLLGQFDGLPNLGGLEKLRVGLNIKPKRQIISFTKNPLENSNLLGGLFTFISQRQVLELHFHKFDSLAVDRTVIVHPYLLKEYNRRWYLIAASEKTGNILTMALDRIDCVIPLPTHRYIEYDSELNERFEDIIGVTLYEELPLQTILFWVSGYSKDYVSTKPLHDSQTPSRGERETELRLKYPMLKGGAFFTIQCVDNYELIRELCAFGKDLLVLSPDNIKQKVYNRIEEQEKAYQAIHGIESK